MSATQTNEPSEALDDGLQLVLPGTTEPAGAGWTWVAEGWKLFTKAPLMWIIAVIIMFLIAIALSLVPFIGSLIYQVLQAVLVAGFVVAARSLEKGGEFELEHLFTGFSKRFAPLAIVGLLFMLGWIVIILVFAVFVGFSILGAFLTGSQEEALSAVAASIGMIILGTLIVTALMVPLLAAYWFAPALVMMHDMKPVEAMKASFFACMRNFLAFLVYSVVMMVALVIALIPFGLGLLVWGPLAIASTYVAYRRIFTTEAQVPTQALPAGPQVP